MMTKFKVGRYLYPVNIEEEGSRLRFSFNYNQQLIDEVKVMEGSRWHPAPDKFWSVNKCPHNDFQIAYLEGKNPYSFYDKPLVEYESARPTYSHQREMTRHGLTCHYCMWAAEMGTGKSLAAIEMMEASGLTNWLWLGPKSALNAVTIELDKWKSRIKPRLMTYDKLAVELDKHGINGFQVPQGAIGDESSCCKNPTAKRTIAFQNLADEIRKRHGENGFVVLMTGSPAPKSPFDWYSQCKIACPGFLREGRFDKFKARLALIKTNEGEFGSFPSIVTWWDDDNKCATCGRLIHENVEHDATNIGLGRAYHPHTKTINEVAKLYERMKGLVRVYFKKDCVDLPEKQYKIIRVQPNRDIINAAKIIAARAKSSVECLTLLRELSDGFQYEDNIVGREECWACKGTKKREQHVPINDEVIQKAEPAPGDYAIMEMPCDICKATGEVNRIERTTLQFTSPKEEVLFDLLDEYDNIGRVIIYGGFTGSIEKCIAITKKKKWNYIKADGKGWNTDLADCPSAIDMLKAFQDKGNDKRIAFIGQPGASGMGLNLSASPVCIYYSNDFNAQSRIQSEDRGHRLDMDIERGYMVIDIFHLPTDQYVYNNLKKKREMQNLTLGEIREVLNNPEIVDRD